MRTHFIAFVPEWIQKGLLRKSLPLESILDIEKMVSVFSIEDLATLVALAKNAGLFSRDGVASSLMQPLSHWYCSAKSERTKNLVDDVAALGSQESFWIDTLKRLTLVAPSLVEKSQKETFEVGFFGNEGVSVVIKEGFPIEAHVINSSDLFKQAVKKLLVFMEYHELMELPIGRFYIESLQR